MELPLLSAMALTFGDKSLNQNQTQCVLCILKSKWGGMGVNFDLRSFVDKTVISHRSDLHVNSETKNTINGRRSHLKSVGVRSDG